MKRIFVIALGGTIGSMREKSIRLGGNNLKIMDYYRRDDIKFDTASPFSILSENMDKELLQQLIDFLEKTDFCLYDGVIILHGSDTLAFTSAVIANAFPYENIILVAADKPIEDEGSNAIENFSSAVDYLLGGGSGVRVSYDGIKRANSITSADVNDVFREISCSLAPLCKRKISNKNVLIIHSYVGINPENYSLDNVDCVLINMYHSATVPHCLKAFAEDLKKRSIDCFFVTHKQSADYETASDIDNIIFGCTIENAYARILLQ